MDLKSDTDLFALRRVWRPQGRFRLTTVAEGLSNIARDDPRRTRRIGDPVRVRLVMIHFVEVTHHDLTVKITEAADRSYAGLVFQSPTADFPEGWIVEFTAEHVISWWQWPDDMSEDPSSRRARTR